MTPQEQIAIHNMRLEGHSPSSIAAALGLSAGTVRSYIHRHPVPQEERCCKQCGRTIQPDPRRREKLFCCDACRMAWWNSHPEAVHRRAYYTLTCQHCGKEFQSYGNKDRKYCCRACYVASRQPG